MGAEPFIPPAAAPAPPDDPVRLGWALGFVAFGLAIAAAVLAYMLPLSVEAQWRHPVATAEITRVRRAAQDDDRASYVVAWTTPDGERLTGTVSPLLADLRSRQTIAVRYAGVSNGSATVFLDTPLEVWGPPVGVLIVAGATLGHLLVSLLRRLLRARPARAPTPGSGPNP
ncbi:MAG: hypothetical protein RL250_72 [Verrucomicrobiota bacterium]|jgi:hypothetical protein